MAFRAKKNPQYPAQPNSQQGQPYPGQRYYEQPKKKKKWPWILLGLILLIIMGSCASQMGKSNDDSTQNIPKPAETTAPSQATEAAPAETSEPEQSPAAKDTQTIELRATATSTGNIMHGAGGSTNTEQFTGEYSKVIEGVKKSDGYMMTVTGDIMDQSSQVTCQIIVDGKVEQEAQGSGAGGGATCTLPAKFW